MSISVLAISFNGSRKYPVNIGPQARLGENSSTTTVFTDTRFN